MPFSELSMLPLAIAVDSDEMIGINYTCIGCSADDCVYVL